MNRTLEFYMEQNYPIVVKELSSADGGGWVAEIPDLPGCIADAETPQEALLNIQDAKLAWLEIAVKRGQKVPLAEEKNEEYSGRFTLRIPKSLHKQLARAAKTEGISLNQYIQMLVSYNFGKKIGSAESNHSPNRIYINFIKEDDIREKYDRSSAKRLWQRVSPVIRFPNTKFPHFDSEG